MLSQQEREAAITRNLPLARYIAHEIARHYGAFGAAYVDDALGDANLGLIHAIDRYDPTRGVPFGPYAARVIAGYVRNGFNRRDLLSGRGRAARRKFLETDDAGPAVHVAEALRPLSLDADSLSEHVEATVEASVEDAIIASDEQRRVREALAQLDQRSQHVILATFADERSMSDVARELHISYQRVQQIRERALSEMRCHIAREGEPTRRGRQRKALANI